MISTETRFHVPGVTWLRRHDGDAHKTIFDHGTAVDAISVELGFCNDPDIRNDGDGAGFYLELQYYHLPTDSGPTYCVSIVANLDLEQIRILHGYCEFLLANERRFGTEEPEREEQVDASMCMDRRP